MKKSLFFFLLISNGSFSQPTDVFQDLGYFINEYFDQKEDALAGKINKLFFLKPAMKLFLFVVIV